MADSWLYSSGSDAVRILRTGTMSIEVCGPGAERSHHAFGDEMELVEFLRNTHEELLASGFKPKGFGVDRRRREERRNKGRGAERRQDYQPLQSNL